MSSVSETAALLDFHVFLDPIAKIHFYFFVKPRYLGDIKG